MNLHLPTEDEICVAFEQGQAAILDLFHEVSRQMQELAQQMAQQAEALQALQARQAKDSRNSSKPPSSDGYGKVKRTESLRKSGDKPNGGQPDHDGQTLLASAARIGLKRMRSSTVGIVRPPCGVSSRWGMKSARYSIFRRSGSK